MKNLQCNGTNSKAIALQNAIEDALKLVDSEIGRIVKDCVVSFNKHTPSNKDCGSIEEWETVNCDVSGYFLKEEEDNNKTGQAATVTIDIKIIDYDTEDKKFIVEVISKPNIIRFP